MIRVEDLTKEYGPTLALDRVSFEVGERQILGFLGPNGAGKSTAMKIITTYLAPGGGSVTVDGIDVVEDPISVRRKIGYLPETNPVYADMRVDDYLEFCGQARGLKGNSLAQRMQWVIDAAGLGRMLKKNINELSKGYKQRTGLAQALIHDPDILVLDEPTSGLDPLQIIEIRSLIQQLAKEKTILFSTHILQEVSSTTDRVIIINQGQIIADGFISDLRRETAGAKHLRLTVAADRADVEREVAMVSGVSRTELVSDRDGAVTVDVHSSDPDVLRARLGRLAVDHGWVIHELSAPTVSLEDMFIELVRASRTGEVQHG